MQIQNTTNGYNRITLKYMKKTLQNTARLIKISPRHEKCNPRLRYSQITSKTRKIHTFQNHDEKKMNYTAK